MQNVFKITQKLPVNINTIYNVHQVCLHTLQCKTTKDVESFSNM